MVKNRLTLTVISIILVFSLVLTACSSGGKTASSDTPKVSVAASTQPTTAATPEPAKKKDPVTLEISWWGQDTRHAAISEALKKFEAKYDWIKVTPTFQGFDGYGEKLTVRLSTGKAPDVFLFSTAMVKELSKGGTMLNLKEHVDKLPYLPEVESIAKPFMLDDKVIGVPAGITNRVMTFDKKVFDDAKVPYPTNDETWVSLGEKWVQVHKANPKVYGSGSWFRGKDQVFMMIKQLGFDPIDLKANPPVMKFPDEMMKIWQWNEQMWKQGVVTRDETVQIGYDSHNVATSIAFTSSLPGEVAKSPDPLGFITLPKKFDADSKSIVQAASPTAMWGVASQNKHIDESLLLLNFLQTDDEAVKTIGLQIGAPPVKKSMDTLSATFKPDSVDVQVMDILKKSQEGGDVFSQPNPPGITPADDAYMASLEKYVFKKTDAKKFMEESAKGMNEKFKEAAAAK